jgi:hypothetical protein
MKRLYLLLSLSISVASSAQNTSPASGAVSGRVLCSDSKTPCRFAIISLVPIRSNEKGTDTKGTSEDYTAASDMAGVFRFDQVLTGRYVVDAHLAGYLLENRDPNDAGSEDQDLLPVITVGPNATSNVDFSLHRGGVISGTLSYDDGAPAVHLPYNLLRKSRKGAWESWSPSARSGVLGLLQSLTLTDDAGRYRQAGLPPGVYAIEATLPDPRALANGMVDINASKDKTLRIFNGLSAGGDAPAGIEINSSEEVAGVDIVIPTSNLYMVSGSVQDQASGDAIGSGQAKLIDVQNRQLTRIISVGSGGDFSFDHVLAGSYTLEVDGTASDGQTKGSYATREIPLSVQGDVTDLEIALQRNSTH